MMYKNIKPLTINIIEYITMLLIILRCNGLFFPHIFKFILPICIISLFLYGTFNIGRYHKNLSNFLLFLIFFVLTVSLFLIFNFYMYHYPLNYVYTYLLQPVMMIVYIYSVIDNNSISISLFVKLENIILCLAAISLFFWILATIGIKPNTYTISNWTAANGQLIPGYFHLSYFSQGKIYFLGFNMLRNTGLFSEAPMYSYILSIALLIELFMKKSTILNYKFVILILTIITTTSSTGIIISIMAILYDILIVNNNNLITLLLTLFLIPVAILFIRIIIIDKIGTGINLYSSVNIRMNDIVASFNTWKQHFFIGNGINNNNAIIQNISSWRFISNGAVTIGLSTGFISTLAYGGILLGSFYVLPTVLLMNISHKFRGLAIFSFILYIFTMVSTTNLYILLLSYFWSVIIYNYEKKKESDIN